MGEKFTWKRYFYDLLFNPDYRYEPKDEFFYFAIVLTFYCVVDLTRKKYVNYYRNKVKEEQLSEYERDVITNNQLNANSMASGRNLLHNEAANYDLSAAKHDLLAHKSVWNQAIKD